MGRDHITTWGCAPHHHSSPRHGIEMVRGNMGCDHTIAWNCPINSRGMRVERRGRGYPEGVILSKGQGWWAQRNLPCLTTFTTESYPLWGLYLFKILASFPHHPHFCEYVNYDDAMPWMVTCNAFDCTQKESTTPKGVAFHTPCFPG